MNWNTDNKVDCQPTFKSLQFAHLQLAAFKQHLTLIFLNAASKENSAMPVCTIFGGWLPAYHYHEPTTTSIVQRRYVWGSKNSHKSGRSLIHCCWAAPVEQPTSPSVWFLTYSPGVPPVTEDAHVLLKTAAPSDGLLSQRLTNLHVHYITQLFSIFFKSAPKCHWQWWSIGDRLFKAM